MFVIEFLYRITDPIFTARSVKDKGDILSDCGVSGPLSLELSMWKTETGSLLRLRLVKPCCMSTTKITEQNKLGSSKGCVR